MVPQRSTARRKAGTQTIRGRTAVHPTWLAEVSIFVWTPLLIVVLMVFANTPDDPLITLRYAANLVHGHGLTFNSGQPVQGFTSPLHLLVAVVAYVLPGGHPLLKLKLASIGFGLAGVTEGYRLLCLVVGRTWLRRGGGAAIASSAVIGLGSSYGLETSLAFWLVALLTRLLVERRQLQSPAIVGATAFAAVLTRPDSLLIVLALAATGILIERRQPLQRRLSWVLGGLMGAGATISLGVGYFHDPLPNAFYAKAVPLATALPLGLHYLGTALQPGPLYSSHTGKPVDVVSYVLLVLQLTLLLYGAWVCIRRRPLALLSRRSGSGADGVRAQVGRRLDYRGPLSGFSHDSLDHPHRASY
jgi:hypothetical protein